MLRRALVLRKANPPPSASALDYPHHLAFCFVGAGSGWTALTSARGFTHLLVAIDKFSKWIEAHCHTRFSEENRMHLICVPGSQFHTYDRLMSVMSQNNAQNVQKRFIDFYYTHEGRHEGLYTNSDNYEDATPSSSSTGF
jgi:GTP cyclohydrolase II